MVRPGVNSLAQNSSAEIRSGADPAGLDSNVLRIRSGSITILQLTAPSNVSAVPGQADLLGSIAPFPIWLREKMSVLKTVLFCLFWIRTMYGELITSAKWPGAAPSQTPSGERVNATTGIVGSMPFPASVMYPLFVPNTTSTARALGAQTANARVGAPLALTRLFAPSRRQCVKKTRSLWLPPPETSRNSR